GGLEIGSDWECGRESGVPTKGIKSHGKNRDDAGEGKTRSPAGGRGTAGDRPSKRPPAGGLGHQGEWREMLRATGNRHGQGGEENDNSGHDGSVVEACGWASSEANGLE